MEFLIRSSLSRPRWFGPLGLCSAARWSRVACCVLLASSCFGYCFWHYGGGLPHIRRSLTDRFIGGHILIHRWLGLADPKPMQAADWVMIAFLGVLLFSTLSHDWHDRDNQPMAHFLLYWFLPAMMYWIARQSPPGRSKYRNGFSRRWRSLVFIWCSLRWPKRRANGGPCFPAISLRQPLNIFGRARGPFLHPAEMGIYLTLCLAAALTFWSRFGRVGKLALLAFAALSLGRYLCHANAQCLDGGRIGFDDLHRASPSQASGGILLLGIAACGGRRDAFGYSGTTFGI